MARPSPVPRRAVASASRLQELVPDAVLVGGSAAAWHAGHRDSSDHYHVLADLDRRFDLVVLEALESQGEWVTNRVTPGKKWPWPCRNVDADPADPVETWPAEAVRAALERWRLSHWKLLRATIIEDPWGPVARRAEEAIAVNPPYGTGLLFADVIADARTRAETAERDAVAVEIQSLLDRSGLTRTEFASRIGTSTSRLSTYLTGRVTPSAALLVRMRRMLSNGE